jgi:hypothetical protein
MEAVDKAKLKEVVKEWIRIDNELKEIARITKEKKARIKELNQSLMGVMKTSNIDSVNTSNDGMIMYVKNKVKGPINKKHLLETLGQLFGEEPEKAVEITNYILENREEKVREVIKRKMTVKDTESVASSVYLPPAT